MNKVPATITLDGSPVGFIYLVAVGQHYKIGHSINVEGVLAAAGRFDASARLISCWPTCDQVMVEGIVHKGLARYRVEREQFNLPAEIVQWIASLDDREFHAWVDESGCDERTIGWRFPRMFNTEGIRGWSCLYFPETDCFAWAMVVKKEKPSYSFIEKAWMQDSRGFRSTWLGRNAGRIPARTDAIRGESQFQSSVKTP